MERILGIDYGDSKVGLSVNDELNIMATPIKTIFYKGNEKLLFDELSDIIKKYNILKIIVGIPLNMNGTKGYRYEKTQEFIQKLVNIYNLPVDTIDERLTTSYSNTILNQLGTKSKKKKKVEDTMSAVYILQDYIDKSKQIR